MSTKANTNTSIITPPKSTPVFGSFHSLPILWEPDAGLFPSESSARWFLRLHRQALIDAEAIAIHTGRILVDPARVSLVAEKVALDTAANSGIKGRIACEGIVSAGIVCEGVASGEAVGRPSLNWIPVGAEVKSGSK